MIVAPTDWAGPLHERPGLFRRKPAKGEVGEDEHLELGPPLTLAHDVDPALKATSGAAQLLKAVGDEWAHRVLVARGPIEATVKVLGEDGKNHNVKVPKIVDSLTVRLRHPDGRAACAVYIDGKFRHAYAWTVCTDPACPRGRVDHPADMPRKLSSNAVRALVRT